MKFEARNTRSAKLTAGQVIDMRHKYAHLRYTQGRLAREYGLSVVQVGRILRGESWQGLPIEPTSEEIAASARRVFESLDQPIKGPALVDKMMEEANRVANPAGLDELLKPDETKT